MCVMGDNYPLFCSRWGQSTESSDPMLTISRQRCAMDSSPRMPRKGRVWNGLSVRLDLFRFVDIESPTNLELR